MTPPLTGVQATAWVGAGNALLLQSLAGLENRALDYPSLLPGWSRRVLLAHVAANAEAVLRLLSWAATGVETRMYASVEQREADIQAGSALPADELRAWVQRGMSRFEAAVADMPDPAWSVEVITAQGRAVSALQVPWMRAREVCVHAVDLGTGMTFADLPSAFCAELLTDISAWRSLRANGPALLLIATDFPGSWQVSGDSEVQRIELPLAELAGYVSGRSRRAGLPELPGWL